MRPTTEKMRPDAHIAEWMSNRQSLINAARKIVGCPHSAEDIVQDAIIKIYEHADSASINDSARYLYRTVCNLAIDSLRRRAREPVCLDEALCAVVPCDRTCDASQSLQGAEALRLVSDALDELPERMRTVFKKHRLDGVPQKDLARQLGVSRTLVNFMVRDAHAYCRARLMLSDVVD